MLSRSSPRYHNCDLYSSLLSFLLFGNYDFNFFRSTFTQPNFWNANRKFRFIFNMCSRFLWNSSSSRRPSNLLPFLPPLTVICAARGWKMLFMTRREFFLRCRNEQKKSSTVKNSARIWLRSAHMSVDLKFILKILCFIKNRKVESYHLSVH